VVFVVFVQDGGCNWREKLPVVQEVLLLGLGI